MKDETLDSSHAYAPNERSFLLTSWLLMPTCIGGRFDVCVRVIDTSKVQHWLYAGWWKSIHDPIYEGCWVLSGGGVFVRLGGGVHCVAYLTAQGEVSHPVGPGHYWLLQLLLSEECFFVTACTGIYFFVCICETSLLDGLALFVRSWGVTLQLSPFCVK